MRHHKYGSKSLGERLERMKQSSNFGDGKFHNVNFTPQLTEGHNLWEVTYEYFFKRAARRKPEGLIPSVKTDLLNLPAGEDVLVWFGHSSYFMQTDGKKILVDPVFSGNASPLRGTNKAFPGTDIYTVADLPEIDYLFITHDHYDHFDYTTLLQLKPKVKKVVCGLGVGAHFDLWGYDDKKIMECDWHETIDLSDGFVAHAAPARHFSGRGFTRNLTLWLSFVLQTPAMKIYIGGDSGYDTHFEDIGSRFGPIDLAILENGQYDEKWRYIHMLPHEVLKAAKELKAKCLFPVHSSKFAMANHSWDEPLVKITELNQSPGIPLITPMIGEAVYLKDSHQQFKQWWVGVK